MDEKNQATATAVEVHADEAQHTTHRQLQPFVPFGARPIGDLAQTEKPKVAVPWLGLGCILVSLLTLMASALILHFIDGHEIITKGLLKPASWISAILSANSIALHIALNEGFNIAWWYRATRQNTTVRDLHDIWTHGTSTKSAFLSGRSFNYIALATMFVATIPLNGFLLQNAVAVNNIPQDAGVNVSLAQYTSLSPGWSGKLNTDLSFAGLAPATSFQMAAGLGAGPNMVVPSTTGCEGSYQCQGAPSVLGFWSECTTGSIPYDLSANITAGLTQNVTLFNSSLTWDPKVPMNMTLTTFTKAVVQDPQTGNTFASCQGSYTTQTCRMQLASVFLPTNILSTLIKNSVDENGNPAPTWSTTLSLITFYGNYKDVLDHLVEASATEGQDDEYSVGPIAQVFAKLYDSNIYIDYQNGNGTVHSEGFFSAMTDVEENASRIDGVSSTDPVSVCNTTVGGLGAQNYAMNIVSGIRSLMWYTVMGEANYASPSGGEAGSSGPQAPQVVTIFDRTDYVDVYAIYWRFWLASLAITLAIVAAVSPLYWGFWTLGRKTTMSPFETARAFHAPVTQDAAYVTETPALLKEVGRQRVHTDGSV